MKNELLKKLENYSTIPKFACRGREKPRKLKSWHLWQVKIRNRYFPN